MTDHLLNNTLKPDEVKLAAYYGRGMVQGNAEGFEEAPLAVIRQDMHPRVAAGLGIETGGRLDRESINGLLTGRQTSGKLVEGKQYAEGRRLPVDPKTGEQRHSTPIGSYDFCPTPDKSVSVAWAFSEPLDQARILTAHLDAAREAVGYIAAEVGKVRLGKGGMAGTEAGAVAWLEFTHHTSRRTQFAVEDGKITASPNASAPGDPDLHTHFLIPNAVFSLESNKVGSLDSAAIGGFIFEADAFYQARLGTNLRDAGFEVALDSKTGAARMTAIPEEVRSLFSKRTNAGEMIARQEAADRGESWDDLSDAQRNKRMKMATQSPEQKQKGDKDDVADVADWRRQAKEFAGWEPKSLQLYGPPLPELSHEQRIRQAYETALPLLAEKLEAKAVITHWDVRVAAARGLVQAGIDGLGDIDAVTRIMRSEGVVQYGEKTALVWGVEDGKRFTSVTTSLHERDERDFITLAQKAATDRSKAIPPDLLERKITESGLDFTGDHGTAQRAAIERLGHGGRFGFAQGAAGAGKTTMLKPLVAAWQEQQRPVWGASLAWRQADDLADAGIDPRNVKAFSVLLDGIRHGSIELEPRSVVAVDEWGLLGTRQALELLRLQDKHGFSIVALGDEKQAASIQAGAIIDLSRRALGAGQVPEIATTLRQQSDREKLVVGLFREGAAAKALTMKREDGTAEMVLGGYAEVVTRVAQLYAERLAATGEAPSISAPTNIDAHRLGEAVRLERRAVGLVGEDIRTVKATDGTRNFNLPLAKGDQVRLHKSIGADFGDKRGGNVGRNGSILTVADVTERGLVLETKTGKVGTVAWDDLAHPSGRVYLSYGSVMTIHTAQGSTSKEHIFALPTGSQAVNGNLAYVANTRHREAAFVVTSEAAERQDVRKRRPLNDIRDITADDKWANVARTFAYQPVKDTAMGLAERVNEMRRGSVKEFHHTLAPAVEQARAHQPPSMAHEVAMQRKVQIIAHCFVEHARELGQRVRQAVDALRQRVDQSAMRQTQRHAQEQHRQAQSHGLGISR